MCMARRSGLVRVTADQDAGRYAAVLTDRSLPEAARRKALADLRREVGSVRWGRMRTAFFVGDVANGVSS